MESMQAMKPWQDCKLNIFCMGNTQSITMTNLIWEACRCISWRVFCSSQDLLSGQHELSLCLFHYCLCLSPGFSQLPSPKVLIYPNLLNGYSWLLPHW